MNKRTVGGRYEEAAAEYLEKCGLTIVERNFRCRMGEIDLIALDKDPEDGGRIFVFIEVKYRRNAHAGSPWEAVGYAKRKTICRVAQFYRLRFGGLAGCRFRFDVISILGDEITWFKNAFPYTE
ncbi:MAG: YraN family protein [Lachnospiraceae bacterium]|nr:YraN family protein [Lachnospiraceae bacterium]